MKKIILALFIFACSIYLQPQGYLDNYNNYPIKMYNNMPVDKIYEKAESFFLNNIKDSALIYYTLVNNTRAKRNDTLFQQIICKSFNRMGTIYYLRHDYKSAIEMFYKALTLCEEIKYTEFIGRVYVNIGNIHAAYGEYKIAKNYFKLAFENEQKDFIFAIYNNLGSIFYNEQNYDSAMIFFKKSYYSRAESKDTVLYNVFNNIAMTYQKLKKYDSVMPYYNAALKNAYSLKQKEKAATFLSNICDYYIEKKLFDSALFYLNQSQIIAKTNNFANLLSENYLYLSQIEEGRGQKLLAFDYYKKYSEIKDSLVNSSQYGDINELRFIYDMSKIDKHVKELYAEQEIKERTINIQRHSQIIMLIAFVVVLFFLFLLYYKNKNLNRVYKTLVDKNMEIVSSDKINHKQKIEYQEKLQEKEIIIKNLQTQLSSNISVKKEIIEPDKYRNSSMSEDLQNELKMQILEIMNDSKIICDKDFSLTKLAEIVGSNQTYVSQVVNETFNKNFKTFVNGYRIKEALKLLQDPENKKYTIESISIMVGFESRSSFNSIFKEVTGVTPAFYARSVKK